MVIPLLLSVAVGVLSGNKVVKAKGIIFAAIISESEDLPVTVMVLLFIDSVPGTELLNLSKIRRD